MKGERVMKGHVVMMVAEGDPHDIGKNIAAVMLRSNGYGVTDMGRDVPVDDVVKTCLEVKPQLVTGTALMTTTMSAFPKVAQRLIENGMEIPFICAGGAVNRVIRRVIPARYLRRSGRTRPGNCRQGNRRLGLEEDPVQVGRHHIGEGILGGGKNGS